MIKARIGKRQKHIFAAAGIILFTAVLFFALIYLPKRSRMKDFKAQLSRLEASIAGTEAMIGDRENLADGMLVLKRQLLALEDKFLAPEEVIAALQLLSRKARELDIDIVSLQPDDVTYYKNKKGMGADINDKPCRKAGVKLDMTASYASLIRYADFIQNNDRFLFTIESVSVTGRKELFPKLSVTIKISSYIRG